MKIQDYHQFNEQVYTTKLENGLSVVIVPKVGFQKTFASLSVRYGSINRQINGQSYPAGIAHFLEHKMFDKYNYDAMDLFAKYGAASNAYTSFNMTSYLFSTINHVYENLMTLLDFVQQPYFEQSKVEKEKGIIKQEIKMYDDDPGAVLYFKTIQNMYPDTALNIDIAGTIDSINHITVEDLYDSYQYFYQPQNMQLTVVGNVNPDEIVRWTSRNQSKKTFMHHVIQPIEIVSQQINHLAQYVMPVFRPKVAIGIKGDSKYNGDIKYELALSMLLELLFTEGSPIYEQLYNQEIIDDSFGFDLDCENEFNFALISGDTEHVDLFIKQIKYILVNFKQYVMDMKNEFRLMQKEEIGQHIDMMNSIETIATGVNNLNHQDINLYDEVEIINQLTSDDLIMYGEEFFNPDNIVVNKVLPANN
jgi:predicted Zn-dependent peptidase